MSLNLYTFSTTFIANPPLFHRYEKMPAFIFFRYLIALGLMRQKIMLRSAGNTRFYYCR